MFVFDDHESYHSIEFEDYCKKNYIIIFYFLLYSSHLTQPLNTRCFNVFKYVYDQELEDLIRVSIIYITKLVFFIAFKSAYFKTIIPENIKDSFQDSGLVSYDL